eukprot:194380-Alexandrium_andersonii.AAC.1
MAGVALACTWVLSGRVSGVAGVVGTRIEEWGSLDERLGDVITWCVMLAGSVIGNALLRLCFSRQWSGVRGRGRGIR